MFITSQTYQKLSNDVILGNSGSAAGAALNYRTKQNTD